MAIINETVIVSKDDIHQYLLVRKSDFAALVEALKDMTDIVEDNTRYIEASDLCARVQEARNALAKVAAP